MNLCVLLTVWAMPFALATSSGEVAEILRRGGGFFPCMWQVQPGICKSGQPAVKIVQDSRLREWCLGTMEAEKNKTFIQNVSAWLGGVQSFPEMNRRLPEVAGAIRQHDTTGMAESFEQISKRIKLFFAAATSSLPDESNALIVTHAFLIKTLIYLFDFENINKISQISNTDSIRLIFDGQAFKVR